MRVGLMAGGVVVVIAAIFAPLPLPTVGHWAVGIVGALAAGVGFFLPGKSTGSGLNLNN